MISPMHNMEDDRGEKRNKRNKWQKMLKSMKLGFNGMPAREASSHQEWKKI